MKRKYKSILWIAVTLFAVSAIAHWTAGWVAYRTEQWNAGHPAYLPDFVLAQARDVFENWHAEFLQIAVLLILLGYYLDNLDRKLDGIMHLLDKTQPHATDDTHY